MYIIPEPKEMKIEKEGYYEIIEDSPIIIPRYNQSDFNSAKCLKERIKEVTGLNIIIEAHGNINNLDRHILLLNLSNCKNNYGNYNVEEYKNKIRDQGYVLEIKGQSIVIVSLDDIGLYYGVQTLRQILNNVKSRCLPLIKIVDYPDLPVRGVMLDISRDWTPKLEILKKLVNDLSEFKINHFQLYIEPHVLKSRRHPVISKGNGSITAEELLELGEICRRSHIDFIPNLQSFGHTSGVLMHKEYEHLAEDQNIKKCLSPVVNETFNFLADYYSEFLPLFNSSFFNVGCDETFEIRMGNGKSAELSKVIGPAGVYFGYIEKIRELAIGYGKQIMIWADQITHTEDEDFLGKTLKLPKDIILINWWYEPEWDYDYKEKILEKTECRHMFCPGTSSWLRFYPEYSRAKRNIRNFSTAAINHNSIGMLISDWGDAGHINLPGQSYYGFLYAANTAWNIESAAADDDEYFDKAYCLNFIGDEENNFSMINDLLCNTYEVSRIDHEFRNVLFDICFFDGLISDEYVNKQDSGLIRWGSIDRFRRASDYTDPQRMDRVAQLLDKALKIYKSINKDDWKQKSLYDEIGYTIKQMMFVCKKYFAIQALKTNDYDECRLKRDLGLLLEENNQLQEMFSGLWLSTAHPEGINTHKARFDWVREDIQRAIGNLF